MSRYTDADDLEKMRSTREFYGDAIAELEWTDQCISLAPSIDLVRCAECKKVREDGGHANCGGYLYCRKWKTLVDEDSYCSWGERRE